MGKRHFLSNNLKPILPVRPSPTLAYLPLLCWGKYMASSFGTLVCSERHLKLRLRWGHQEL